MIAKTPHPAVPESLLLEVMAWQKQGVSMSDAVDRLRSRTVPHGYTPHTWTPGIYKLILLSVHTVTNSVFIQEKSKPDRKITINHCSARISL